jgi:hypothetical protein
LRGRQDGSDLPDGAVRNLSNSDCGEQSSHSCVREINATLTILNRGKAFYAGIIVSVAVLFAILAVYTHGN